MISINTRIYNFLDSVSFVADKNRQYEVWVEGKLGIASVISPGELFAQFFDDNDIDDFIASELEKTSLTLEQKRSVVAFRDALDHFVRNYDFSSASGDILVNPRWQNMMCLAEGTLAVFEQKANHNLGPHDNLGS